MPRFSLKGTGWRSVFRAIGRKEDRRVRINAAVSRNAIARAAVEALEDRRLLSTTFYVSNSGNDTAGGTSLSAPFRTIQKAASVASAGDTVLIRGGTYRETVTPSRSGTSSAPIVYKPYNDENVTISGADPISNFVKHDGQIYKANLPWDLGLGKNQVFVDGEMMFEARWPNTQIGTISNPSKARGDAGTSGGTISGTIVDADLSGIASGTFNGAMIHIVGGEGWLGGTGTVSSQASGRFNFSLSKAIPSTGGTFKATNRYFLTGKFKMLDSAGEWFRDSSGALYLWAPGGADPDTDRVEVKRRTYAFNLDNKSYTRLEDLNIFAASVKTGWSSTGVVLDGIDARYVSHFTQISGSDSMWSVATRDTGIELRGSGNTIRNSVIAFSAGNGVTVQGNNNSIRNSIIRDVNYTPLDTAAVWTSGRGITIDGNTMYNSGRSLIKHNGSPGIKITHNHLYNAGLQTNDGGATYTYGENGAGAEIAYNVIHGVHTEGKSGGVGIYLDRYSNNWSVHHNVVYDCDSALKMTDISKSNKIVNNTLIGDPKSVGQWRNLDFGGTVFRNNIFTGPARLDGASQSNNIFESTNPKFTDPGRRNYSLQAGSPAINKAAVVSGITTNSSPDIGAYEYGQSLWSAGATIRDTGGAPVVVNPPAPEPTPTPVPTPTPTPTPTPGTISARSTIQAEKYTNQSGVVRTSTHVTDTDNGNWIKFSKVDFGTGVRTLRMSLAVASSAAGGRIEFRAGSTSGALIGSYTTVSTGGWSSWKEISTTVGGTTGVKDVYVVFKSSRSGDIANLSWFQFS